MVVLRLDNIPRDYYSPDSTGRPVQEVPVGNRWGTFVKMPDNEPQNYGYEEEYQGQHHICK